MPLYVRAGAMIPMGPVKQYTGEKVDGPLTLWVHPGADGAFSWYEDDGTTFDFRKGQFMKVNVAWNDGQRRLTLRLANGAKMLCAGETRHCDSRGWGAKQQDCNVRRQTARHRAVAPPPPVKAK